MRLGGEKKGSTESKERRKEAASRTLQSLYCLETSPVELRLDMKTMRGENKDANT